MHRLRPARICKSSTHLYVALVFTRDARTLYAVHVIIRRVRSYKPWPFLYTLHVFIRRTRLLANKYKQIVSQLFPSPSIFLMFSYYLPNTE